MADRDYMEVIAEADRFQAFRDDESTQTCLEALERQFTETWASTDKPEIADALWHRVRAVRQFRQEIQARVDAGKVARAEMKRDGDYQSEKPKTKPSRRKKAS